MRLLIYLLALISGFSAAEAARAQIAPASSVAQTAVAAAEELTAQERVDLKLSTDDQLSELAVVGHILTASVPSSSTPVARHDLTRE